MILFAWLCLIVPALLIVCAVVYILRGLCRDCVEHPEFLDVQEINRRNRASHDTRRRMWFRIQNTLRRMH